MIDSASSNDPHEFHRRKSAAEIGEYQATTIVRHAGLTRSKAAREGPRRAPRCISHREVRVTDTIVDVRPKGGRATTRLSWLDSRHSFSFGSHYDSSNTHFGLLLVSNDDVVAPNSGFSTHPHRDMEIVTWVLDGELIHQDSTGHTGLITPGLAQRMSAGTGILHSELNGTGSSVAREPVHFIQMWVVPDDERVHPSYDQHEISAELDSGGLVPVASGRGHDAAISIQQRDAVLYAARLASGDATALPVARYVHLYVARGGLLLEGGGQLDAGDAARITAGDGQRLTATEDPTEVLVWGMHSSLTAWSEPRA